MAVRRQTKPFLVRLVLDSQPLLRAVLLTVCFLVGMQMTPPSAFQTRSTSLQLVPAALPMLSDMFMIIAKRVLVETINVVRDVQIVLRQPSSKQPHAWEGTMLTSCTSLQSASRAAQGQMAWSVQMIVNARQERHALLRSIAAVGAMLRVSKAGASAIHRTLAV